MKKKLPEKSSKFLEQIGNKVKNLDEKNLYYLFGAVLVSIFILDYLILMRPQLNALYKLGPNIQTLTAEINKNIDDAWNIEEYAKDIKRLSKEAELVGARVKSKEEVSIILEQISLVADKNHIMIDQIAPVFQNQIKVLDSKDLSYYKLPIEIDARASYHDLGRFINQLENADLYFKVTGFSVVFLEAQRLNMVKITVDVIIFDKLRKPDAKEDKKNQGKKQKTK